LACVPPALSGRLRAFWIDWAPFLGLILLYDALRGLVYAAVTSIGLPVYMSYAIAGERLLLNWVENDNYRTIAGAALAYGHCVVAQSPIDVNLAKQLNILISDMGLPMERIVMDPTTGALGYGMEYGYSVMERLRLAALQGDGMTQQPMLVTPGEESWRAKEARAGEGVPEAWGDWVERAINWETLTASTLIESGADILVLRHPESVKRVRAMIDALMSN